MFTVKVNVHPDDCGCERSPSCRGKFVVNLPDTGATPQTFGDYESAETLIREYATGGVPEGEPGVHGAIRQPSEDKLRH